MRRELEAPEPNIEHRVLLILSLLALLLGVPAGAQDQGPADQVFKNGYIYTVNSYSGHAEAVAIKDGKLIVVGSNEDVKSITGPATEVVDLQGRMVMPGIVDSHVHAIRGAIGRLFMCQFPATSTPEEIISAVKGCAAKLKEGEWLEGKTWPSALEHTLNKSMLDAVAPDNPVLLHDDTNHLQWVNSKALETAAITNDTPDPPGGQFDRDSSGELTGIVREKAAALITKHMPPPQRARPRASGPVDLRSTEQLRCDQRHAATTRCESIERLPRSGKQR